MTRIALFGGTFDPVHVGHLAIAEAARRAIDGEVIFVPTGRNPLKAEEPAVSAAHRVELVRRALDGASGMRVDRDEIERREASYTVDTLRRYAREGVALHFVLGADALVELPRWRSPDEILRLATLLVAKRPGASAPDVSRISAIAREAKVRLLDAPLVDLSSRELREYARGGGSLRYLVPEAAWRYMVAKGLYGQVERT